MLLRTLHVAMFFLMVWLTFQLNQTNARVSALQTLSQNQQHVLDNTLASTQKASSEKLDALSEQLNKTIAAQKNNTGAEKKLNAFKTKQNKIDTLRKAYILVLEAEAARASQDSKVALERLTASKKLIWKSGSNFPDQKKSLQGLMKTIDLTLGAWKQKDLKKDTKAIYSVIAKAIKTQDK
ncbi:MAG: hypothetical protein ACPG51_06830 [Thiolinea sp.]